VQGSSSGDDTSEPWGGGNHDLSADRGVGRVDAGVSARRRLFVASVALLLVLAAAVATIAAVRSSGGADPVAQDRPGPVLLVPGYGGGGTALARLADVLRAAGREATVVRLPGDGTGPLGEQAKALSAAATAAVAAGASSVDVVGYSAGGVVARLWVAGQGGAGLARRVVTLGAPQHGTDVAGLAAVLAPGSCPAACQQLAPDSPLLGRLNRGDETPAGPVWVSIWTTGDQVVTPPSSASLDGALDITVQDVCPRRQVAHGELPTDAAVQALVLDALAIAPPSAPRSCPG
jgi:triacylglycerol lipase